jgi:hypothetical protein
MFGIWLAVAEGTLLGFDAQRVIALRAMKIAAGGSSARSEVRSGHDDREHGPPRLSFFILPSPRAATFPPRSSLTCSRSSD